MAAPLDHLVGRLRREDVLPDDDPAGPLAGALGRWPVTKASWRGKYRRLMSVTPSALVTQHPDTLAVTNVWHFSPAPPGAPDGAGGDVEAVGPSGLPVPAGGGAGGGAGAELEFTLSARPDAKSRYKPVKFTCRHRAELLAALHAALAAAAAGPGGPAACPLAARVLGAPVSFAAHKRRRDGTWAPCTLVVTARGLERRRPGEGWPAWTLEWRSAGSPAAVLLKRAPAVDGATPEPGEALAIMARTGGASRAAAGAPKVFALHDAAGFLRTAASVAAARAGIELAVDGSRAADAPGLLAALAGAEREVAGGGSGGGAAGARPSVGEDGVGPDPPVGEWRAARAFPGPADGIATAAPVGTTPASRSTPPPRLRARVLTLTRTALVERRHDTYAVLDRRPLTALVTAAAPVAEPGRAILSWADGAADWEVETPDRDAFVAALVAAVAGAVAAAAAGGAGGAHGNTAPPPPTSLAASLTRPAPTVSTGALPVPASRLPPIDACLARAAAAGRGSGSGSAGDAEAAELEAAAGGHLAAAARALLAADPDAAAGPPIFTPAAREPALADVAGVGAGGGGAGGGGPAVVEANGGGGRPAAASTSGPAFATPPTASSARARLARRAAAFAAVVPGSGPRRPGGGRADEPTLQALLSLLPPPPPPSVATADASPAEAVLTESVSPRRAGRRRRPACGPLTPGAAADAAAALAALQRLAASPSTAAALLSITSAAPRIFTCLDAGAPQVVAEAARLLTRLWSPAAAATGGPPWDAPWKNSVAATGAEPSRLPPDALPSVGPDGAAAASAKAVCLGAPGRAAALAGVLLGGSGGGGSGAAASAADSADPPARRHPTADHRLPPSPLATLAAVDALAAAAVPPGVRTTGGRARAALLAELADAGPALFALFSHPAAPTRVGEGAALLVRAVASAGPGAAAPMRDAALADGALLTHLAAAVGDRGPGGALSRDLVALWADGHPPALALLRRVFPAGLARHLTPRPAVAVAPQPQPQPQPQPPPQPQPQPQPPPPVGVAESPAPAAAGGAPPAQPAQPQPPAAPPAPVGGAPPQAPPPGPPATQQPVPLSSAQAMRPTAAAAAAAAAAPTADWAGLWRDVWRDHAHAGLVWNERTRAELRAALAAEAAALRRGKASAAGGPAPVVWNHWECAVSYPSLAGEPCVGGVYVRLLLDGPPVAIATLPAPRDLFHALWAELLAAGAGAVSGSGLFLGGGGGAHAGDASSAASSPDARMELCARAAAAVYDAHAGSIGPFAGGAHVAALVDGGGPPRLRAAALRLLESVLCPAAARRDRAALAATARARADFAAAGGVELLVDVAAAAHTDGGRRGGGGGGGEAAAPPPSSSSSTTVPLHTALIAAEAHEPERREWYVSDAGLAAAAARAEGGGGGEGGEDGAAAAATPPAAVAPGDGAPLFGPLTRAGALRAAAMAAAAAATAAVPPPPLRLWAAGMGAALPAAAIRDLRWGAAAAAAAAAGAATPAGARPRDMAEAALRTLLGLASSPVGPDAGAVAGAAGGAVLVPPPRTLRALGSPACMATLAQQLLTGDPALVSLAAALLTRLATDGGPGAAAGLYRTGAFYFALAYGGSNLGEVAALLAATHAAQDWPPGARRSPGAGGPDPSTGLRRRARPEDSFVGHLLPHGLLHVLECHGPGAFAAALAGDTDSPELVWTAAMRAGRLIPQMRAHIGDLPARLRANARAPYDFLPSPPVDYPELADEVWCHRYCLRNLCDGARFPAWPLDDHVTFLQALLAEWRTELARAPDGLSAADALAELGLDPGPGGGPPSGDALRAAYRAAARKFHPDRNPEGRERFEAAAKAYERLASDVRAAAGGAAGGAGAGVPGGGPGGGGARRWRLLLLLRAQALLYARAADVLAPYRYAGYRPLVRTVARRLAGLPDGDASAAAAEEGEEGGGGGGGGDAPPPTDGDPADDAPAAGPREHFLSPSSAPLLQAAADLCALTAAASPGNAAELARCGGASVLPSAVARATGALPPAGATDAAPAARLAVACLRAVERMAGGEAGRAALWSEGAGGPALAGDVVRLAALGRGGAGGAAAPPLTLARAAVDAAAALAASPTFQDALLDAGALRALVPLLFGYDPTLDEEAAAAGAAALATGAALGGGGARSAPTTAPALPPAPGPAAALPAPGAPASSSTALSIPAAPGPAGLASRVAGALPAPASGSAAALRGAAPADRASASTARPSVEPATVGLARNALALASARCLALLAGAAHPPGSSPPNARARAALAALLTPPLARRLASPDAAPLLADLAGSVRSPQAIWDPGMRTALLAALDGPAAAEPGPGALAHLSAFSYPALSGELVVSGVYVRLFVGDPAFPLADPAALVRGLVTFIHGSRGEGGAGGAGGGGPAAPTTAADPPTARRHLCEALAGLRAALEACPRAAGVMAARPALAPLIATVEDGGTGGGGGEHSPPAAATLALAALVRLTAHAGCVAALSERRALRAAFFAAAYPPTPPARALALRLLAPLADSAEAAWEGAAGGGALCLLTLLLPAGSARPPPPTEDERAAAAGLLARLVAHPLHGQRVALLLGRLLPPGALAVLADGPGDAAAAALAPGGAADGPVHVWSPAMASAIADGAAGLAEAARAALTSPGGPDEWVPPGAGRAVDLPGLDPGEPFVGGVYVRRFLASPGAPLRDPVSFLDGLLESYASAALRARPAPDTPAAVLAAAAAAELLRGRPPLRERAAGAGAVRTALAVLASRLPAGAPPPPAGSPPDDLGGSALRLLHAALADCPAAADALAAEPPAALAPLGRAARAWGLGAEVLAAEALARGLTSASRGRASLVAAAASAGLVPVLLARLSAAEEGGDGGPGGGGGCGDAAVARVAALDALRAMADPAGGGPAAAVAAQLDGDAAWAAHGDARHDLYLPAGGVAGGGGGGAAGGALGDGVAGLLGGGPGGAGAFALPAPAPAAPVVAPAPAPEPAVAVAPPAREPSPPPAREPSPPPPPPPPLAQVAVVEEPPPPPPREPTPIPAPPPPPPPPPPPSRAPEPECDPLTGAPVPTDDNPLG